MTPSTFFHCLLAPIVSDEKLGVSLNATSHVSLVTFGVFSLSPNILTICQLLEDSKRILECS